MRFKKSNKPLPKGQDIEEKNNDSSNISYKAHIKGQRRNHTSFLRQQRSQAKPRKNILQKIITKALLI